MLDMQKKNVQNLRLYYLSAGKYNEFKYMKREAHTICLLLILGMLTVLTVTIKKLFSKTSSNIVVDFLVQ